MTPSARPTAVRVVAEMQAARRLPADATGFDLILVGGGLANGLVAWRLAQLRPECRWLLLERDERLGGNHTWSFHPTDLDDAERRWLEPFVVHRWLAHDVVFPGTHRRLSGGYASITSNRFDALLGEMLRSGGRGEAWLGVEVGEVGPSTVTLADGRVLRAGAVIDGRGIRPSRHLRLGFQKFLGQEVELAEPHGLDAPILMDADVTQSDGYRFVYVLPMSPTRLLIEDTVYADGEHVDAERLRDRIGAYARAHGWRIDRVVREEQGVLPIVLDGDVRAFWREAGGVAQSGLAAGLFHPTTGYSLPDAVALADRVARLPTFASPAVYDALRRHAIGRWHDRRFFRLLNRMLFQAAVPALRWKVMCRFYGLREPLIARFYAGSLRPYDKLRIVTGKPPVPFWAGVRAAFNLGGNVAREATTP